jgi:hypothetical protein
VVEDLVELEREQVVDLRDARVDHRLRVAATGDRALEHLGDEALDEVLAARLRLGVPPADAACSDDLARGATTRRRRCTTRPAGQPGSQPSVSPPGARAPCAAAHLVGVAERRLEHLVELLVGLQRAAQVGQLRAQVEQLAQRLHLAGDGVGREVVDAAEVEVDGQLGRVGLLAQLVLDGEREVRLHARQHVVEVVGRDLDELPLLERGAARWAAP